MGGSDLSESKGRLANSAANSGWLTKAEPLARSWHLEFLLLAALSFLFTFDLRLRTVPLFVGDPDFDKPWDHQKYLYMVATNPFGFHIAPYCWRVGVPLLARLLPFGDYHDFVVLAFLGVMGSGLALYYLIREAGLPVLYGVVGLTAFFTMEWAAKFALYDIWLPDPIALLCTTTALILALRAGCARSPHEDGAGRQRPAESLRHSLRSGLPFAAILAFGVLVKESVLFVIPVWWAFRARPAGKARAAAETGLLSLPALLIFISLRLAITARNGDAAYLASLPPLVSGSLPNAGEYSPGSLFRQIGLSRIHGFSWDAFVKYTVDPFKLQFLALAIWGSIRHRDLFLRVLPLLMLIYAQLLFASDKQRLLAAGVPAVLLLAMMGTEELVRMIGERPVRSRDGRES